MYHIYRNATRRVYTSLIDLSVCSQRACLLAVPSVADYIDEESARKLVFPRARAIYEKNSIDLLVRELHQGDRERD